MELRKPGPAAQNGRAESVLREALEDYKTEVVLEGEMCLDDSDAALPMIWSRGSGLDGEGYIVCWKAADPGAAQMKDMVENWAEFVILSAEGAPLGGARDFFLTK